MSRAKVLVVHLSSDDLNSVLEKIKKLNVSAGPFDYVFLIGNFESIPNSLNASGLPEIITISSAEGAQKSTSNSQQYGILDLNKKLRVGFITLKEDELTESASKVMDTFDGDIDILVTSCWSIAMAEKKVATTGNRVIDEVCKKTRPSYHFSFSDTDSFFELEPFPWADSVRTTRFINLAAFHSKKKWAYAFSILLDGTDQKSESSSFDNMISNPYTTQSGKRILQDVSSTKDVEPNSKRKKAVLPSDCHFCFTNPNVEDHMFISIGNHVYLTTAKGPLSVPSGDMDFHGHCLIVPIEHIPKLNIGQKDFLESETRKELRLYESSVVKMNHRKFDMSTIVFEIHWDKSVHFHKQIIPVPKYLIMRFKDALERQVYMNNERYTTNGKMDFSVFSSSKDQTFKEIIEDPKRNYFQFSVYETSQDEPTIYLSPFDVNDRLDLQFGRRVAAYLMRLPKRVNWSSSVCKQSKEQEINEVEKFQKSYSEFDISN